MSEWNMLWLSAAVFASAFGVFMWAWCKTWDEAERKLGREPTWHELIFAVLAGASAPPLTTLAVAAFVWWLMPELAGNKSAAETMTAPPVPQDQDGKVNHV